MAIKLGGERSCSTRTGLAVQLRLGAFVHGRMAGPRWQTCGEQFRHVETRLDMPMLTFRLLFVNRVHASSH